VAVGEQFAFQGRVFDTSDADGKLAVRGSGDVLARVVDTFVRMAPAVIDAEVSYADGTRDTLTGTPNHPFWVDAVRDYVPLGELEVGTVLHVQGGGEAILVSKTWRQGEFVAERSDVGESPERSGGTVRVFDFEVEGLHNFYVRGEGSDAAGVLVHNSTKLADDALVVRGGVTTPKQIERGIGPHRDVEGLTGFSAQSKAGATVEELASTGGVGNKPFPHNQVSVTTVGDLKCIGCDVVPSPGAGANHVTVTPGSATPEQISEVFTQQPNPAKIK